MKASIRGINTLLLVCLLVCSMFKPTTPWASEGNIDTSNKYAWSENAGWLNFRPTNGGVTVHDTYLSGYSWAENIGWIKLGSGTGPYGNTTSTNWGVNHDNSTGALSGYAWSENAGWINFDSTNGLVTIDPSTGKFSGYAWAENVGWIHFKYDDPEYYVQVAAATGTYYVDIVDGNDSNNGSQAHPWKTFHYAISRINGGAAGTYILIMAAGTYSTDNGEAVATLIISQSNVTIIGADHHAIGTGTTLIDGTGTSINDWIYGINPTGSNITIKDLSIKNFSTAGQYGIYMSASTETEVINCKISNNHTGIELAAGSNTFKIQFCEIYENTTDGLNVLSSTGGEIYRNTIYRHQDDGIAVFGCSPAIKRNKIYDNDTGIRVEANSTASPDISNNIIYETTDYTMNHGILVTCLSGGTARPTIYHNTIDGGSGDGIEIDWRGDSGDVAAPVIKYNIITRCNDTGSFGINANAGATCAPNYNDVWGNAQCHKLNGKAYNSYNTLSC